LGTTKFILPWIFKGTIRIAPAQAVRSGSNHFWIGSIMFKMILAMLVLAGVLGSGWHRRAQRLTWLKDEGRPHGNAIQQY
jgi:hypothetical protein